MNAVLPTIRSTINPIVQQSIGRGKRRYDSALSLLWYASDATTTTTRSRVGPNAAFASAGATADGNGGTLAANVPCVQTINGRKVMWNGPAYSNLLPSISSALSNWSAAGITVNADTITPSINNVEHYVASPNTGGWLGVTSGVRYHATVKAKANGYNFLISLGSGAGFPSNRYAWFNLALGTVGTVQENANASISGPDSDGFYTCYWSCIANLTIAGGGSLLLECSPTDNVTTFAGNGTSGVRVKDFFFCSNYGFPYIAPGISSASCAGTTGLNGTTFPMDFNTVAGQRLLETFRGVPDGVEVSPGSSATLMRKADWPDSLNEDATHILSDVAGGLRFQSDTVSPSLYLRKVGILEIGARYLMTISGLVTISGTIYTDCLGATMVITNGTFEGVATDAQLYFIRNSPNIDLTIGSISIQKLNPAVGSLAVLVRMGAGSAEIPNSTTINCVSKNGVAAGILHSSIGSGSEDNIALSSDGATLAAVAATTWSANEYHLKRVEFNGTKFRVGNRRYSSAMVPIDAGVWSHATLAGGATFDGSFNPLPQLIQALTIAIPHHTAAIAAWRNKIATDAEVYAEIHRKYPIGA